MPVLAFTWGSYAEIWRSSWAWLSDSHPRISNYFAQSLNESLCSCISLRCVIDYLRQTHDMCILVCGIIDALLLNILIHMISLWGHCFIKKTLGYMISRAMRRQCLDSTWGRTIIILKSKTYMHPAELLILTWNRTGCDAIARQWEYDIC